MESEAFSFFTLYQSSFLFGIVWSIGATCDINSRVKFDVYYKELMSGKNEEHPVPTVVGKIETPMPTDHPVYDYMFEVRAMSCYK